MQRKGQRIINFNNNIDIYIERPFFNTDSLEPLGGIELGFFAFVAVFIGVPGPIYVYIPYILKTILLILNVKNHVFIRVPGPISHTSVIFLIRCFTMRTNLRI